MFPLILFILSLHSISSYKIEGVINQPNGAPNDWAASTRVLVDGNKYVGYVQQNGYFVISNIDHGSYLLEFVNPTYLFQPVRVEITSKGKIRARKVLPIKPNTVITVSYPLRITSLGKTHYFQEREQIRTLDLFLNPTVLVLVAPLLLFMILPKLADTNDPEFQKEMQNFKLFSPKEGFLDVSEMLTSMGKHKSTVKKSGKKKLTNVDH